MEKLYLFFVFAILSNGVLGISLRNKRQAEEQEDLEDRYGWNRTKRPIRPVGSWSFKFPDQFRVHSHDRFHGHFSGQFSDPFHYHFPGQQTDPRTPTPVPTPSANGVTTQSSSVQDCIRTCPVTSEYNPVCGSDTITYDNPGRLLCAQACGVSVNLLRSLRCPATTAAPAS